MGHAVQIVSTKRKGENCELILNKSELQKILSQGNGKHIAVLSAAGGYRLGKSFLLTWLSRYLTAQGSSDWLDRTYSANSGFTWKNSEKAVTEGIWAWSELFFVKNPNDSSQEIAVLLLDTQGLFDGKTTHDQTAKIFALSTLISSVMVFNLSQRLREDDLQHLKVFTDYSRQAADFESGQSSPFERLVFLIRDWPNAASKPFGAAGGQDYLEDFLSLASEGRDQADLRETRQHVRESFARCDAFLMPTPGRQVREGPDYDGGTAGMEERFCNSLKELAPYLLSWRVLEPKKVSGQPIKAQDLADFLEAYVTLFNNNKVPSPLSMVQATTRVANDVAARRVITNAKEKIEKAMSAAASGPDGFIYGEDLRQRFSQINNEALGEFKKARSGTCTSQLTEERTELLRKELDELLREWLILNEKNRLTRKEEARKEEAENNRGFWAKLFQKLEEKFPSPDHYEHDDTWPC